MHVSWDMHNVTLNYALSNASVLGATFNATAFTKMTASNAPTLFPSSGTTTNEVTYPQFYQIPNSSNMLFTYRNGGAGGGSGNGNQYFNTYNPTTRTWSQTFVINGIQTSVNAYLNSMDYDANNNLVMTWTYRATANWQTNSNIYYAQSPDNGVTWKNQTGTAYTLPLVQNTGGATTASNPQVIKTIPQGDSFINQTSMSFDTRNHPMVATYFSPGWTATSATAGSGNPNRQYELVYYTGSTWVTSQISSRTHDASVDYSGADVRDLGRPIVLVDPQNRILVITRSTDAGLGASLNNSAASTGTNNIVIYYTTDSIGAGNLPATLNWQSITLDAANMGIWEPTYDSTRWSQSGILDLFYEPVGLSGQSTGTVSVLEWNEQSFFATPEPSTLGVLAVGAALLLKQRGRRMQRGSDA